MKLDPKQSYAVIYGHDKYAFQQGGQFFDAKHDLVEKPDLKLKPVANQFTADELIETDQVASAKEFLTNLLSGGPMAKTVVYNEAEKNNQLWEDVQKAAVLMNIQAKPMGSGAKKIDGWFLARE
jgi:hypothetical protein